jgi:NAD(P)-dependent dehydrogenase (short-subunit alcohol dehydrogenase family)
MTDKLFGVKDKIVIITGGFGQIGAELVKEFHERGSRVAVFARNTDAKKIATVLPDISGTGHLCLGS